MLTCEDGNRYKFLNVVFFRVSDDGQSPEVIDHSQNPLELKLNVFKNFVSYPGRLKLRKYLVEIMSFYIAN